ncbi:cation transporter [Marinithermofilum abyssi]|uniref:Cation transporter n=1 Tax=Marinithermofilum abyssi TaxID=1571185 RepID=A0A8J2YEH2_9BACL|nr:cation diffusion facilitator family transporter [Marinithermofilum abyssi]GGE23509.1 cation transporter [Marinithermofilum abyssi]
MYHHEHEYGPQREQNKQGLTIALAITTGIMVLEFVGGILTQSLALLSDSGHMLSDASSLAFSLIAMRFASKPPTPQKTYGFYRFEILAALFNGITLFAIAGFIVWEAIQRFLHPPKVASGSMIVIAALGLTANLASAWILLKKGDVNENVNVRSAYLHVLGDALGSVGAIAAGLLMLGFSWYVADPVISLFVAVLILKSAWGVLSHAIHILMEGTPTGIDQTEVRQTLLSIPGVLDIHDLHIWTITSGLNSLSCHLLVQEDQDEQEILQQAIQKVEEQFHIKHATIQVEKSDWNHEKLDI